MLHLIQFVGGCSHDAGSVTDRPRGNNMYTILHFGSEATLEIEGEARQMTKDCFVIITPRTSYRYYNNDAAFTEDGIFFDGEIPFALIDELKLPVNRPFQVSSPEEVVRMIHWISEETVKKTPHYEQRVDLLLRSFMYALSDAIVQEMLPATSLYRQLAECREQMIRSPEKDWKMSEIAAELNISPSYFQHLYRACFGESPRKELIACRLEKAQYLLRTTDLSVKEVSAQCGYANVEHFVRQFGQTFGQTPKAYKRGK